jgi:hypothetical protein
LYLAQPIHASSTAWPELDAWVKPEALITDAGSTKQAIVDRASQVISRASFWAAIPWRDASAAAWKRPKRIFSRPAVRADAAISPAELETPAAREFLGWIRGSALFP